MEISLEQYNKMAERMTELEYLLAEQPEIIRCKDCKYGVKYCHRVTFSNGAYDFCSHAERKGEQP